MGRLDKLGDKLESVAEGLCRITGRTLPDKPDVAFESSRAWRWLQTVCIPGVSDLEKVDHQHLLCAMDAFNEHQAAVSDQVTELLRPLIDQELSVVFYDMTTIRTEGLT